MKEIKKNASIKSKVKDKDVKFNIDLDYSPEYDSFNIKVKKGEGFMSYTDALQGLPLEVVQKINEMLEEVLVKAGSEYEMKEHKMFDGGKVDSKLTENEVEKIAEATAKALGSKFSVTKGTIDNGSFDLDYDGVKYDGGSYIVLDNGDVKNVAIPEKPIVYNYKTKKKFQFGGDFQSGVYNRGGAVKNERLHVNKGEDYEVRYAKPRPHRKGYKGLRSFEGGGEMDLTDDKRLRLRKPVMPERKYSKKEWAEKYNPRAYEFMGKDKMATGGGVGLIGNQKRIDMNHNGKIDAEDFKLLRSSMNGAWRNERKHVNHNEDYEVRYARKKPARTGYKGKRNFEGGGGVSFGGKNPKIEKYSVYIEYGNDDDNEMKVVELDFPNLQQASNFYKKYSNSNKYKGQDILDIMILKYYENGDFEQIDNNYSKGGYVEITDPKRELFDKGYAIYGGDAWEKFEDVKKIPLPKGAFIVKVKTNNNNYFAIAEKRKMTTGGGISNFERLSRVVAKNYEGKRVKPQYQKEYGKVYSKSEAKEVGNKVAGKVKAMKKAESGTEVKKGGKGGIMVLAKQIRKEGESWQDAVKRAGQQLK